VALAVVVALAIGAAAQAVSAKSFSSILSFFRSSICVSKMSISRPHASGMRAPSVSFQVLLLELI
jgi:hypothetical protein